MDILKSFKLLLKSASLNGYRFGYKKGDLKIERYMALYPIEIANEMDNMAVIIGVYF
jgi:hypothetical protein